MSCLGPLVDAAGCECDPAKEGVMGEPISDRARAFVKEAYEDNGISCGNPGCEDCSEGGKTLGALFDKHLAEELAARAKEKPKPSAMAAAFADKFYGGRNSLNELNWLRLALQFDEGWR